MTLLNRYLTATNADVLSGTELDPPEYSGVMSVWAFSDNDTATLQLGQVGYKSGVTNIIPITDSNARPDIKKQVPYMVNVTKSVKPVVVVGGTVSKVWLIFDLKAQGRANHIIVCKYFSATNADVFASTHLDTPYRSGKLMIWSGSDVVTATLECIQKGHKVGKTSLVPFTDTDASIDVSLHKPLVIDVVAGNKPIVALGGTVTEAYIFAVLV